jgi:hypothetical protein
LHDTPKFTQIGIFGMKLYHLATLFLKVIVWTCVVRRQNMTVDIFIQDEAEFPDGSFSYQKSQFGYILEGLGMKNVGIFYDHSEYFHGH